MIYGIEAAAFSGSLQTPAYIARAVHFAGGFQAQGPTWLDCASLTTPADNGYFAFSFWQLGLLDPANAGCTVWATDASSSYNPWAGTMTPMGPIFEWQFDPFDTNWNSGLPPYNQWNHFLGSAETNLSAGNKVKVLYVNDELIAADSNADAGAAFVLALNGKQFTFGDDALGDGPTIDVSDVWFAPNVKLHDGTNIIPEATRRQFIDAAGKPVDPAGWPTSAVQFYGDSTSFATNRGTGGAFTLTGTLTDASTHP